MQLCLSCKNKHFPERELLLQLPTTAQKKGSADIRVYSAKQPQILPLIPI
jgi:hypothetical protein